ncbi:Cysteine-rich protein 2-like [Homarus americanus]|uniref:Cysteine-rich protein 1 n=1 Tax=Homarus americanus TaxID=6706 RepID=A0A8J5JDU8_HOMAM|nr:Cysteine-rich protein 2-like [Homarus americanus]
METIKHKNSGSLHSWREETPQPQASPRVSLPQSSAQGCFDRSTSGSVLLIKTAAERKTSLGKDWHSFCLKCEKCNKTLTPGSHSEHQSKPYCTTPCYGALFGPGGMSIGPIPHPQGQFISYHIQGEFHPYHIQALIHTTSRVSIYPYYSPQEKKKRKEKGDRKGGIRGKKGGGKKGKKEGGRGKEEEEGRRQWEGKKEEEEEEEEEGREEEEEEEGRRGRGKKREKRRKKEGEEGKRKKEEERRRGGRGKKRRKRKGKRGRGTGTVSEQLEQVKRTAGTSLNSRKDSEQLEQVSEQLEQVSEQLEQVK